MGFFGCGDGCGNGCGNNNWWWIILLILFCGCNGKDFLCDILDGQNLVLILMLLLLFGCGGCNFFGCNDSKPACDPCSCC